MLTPDYCANILFGHLEQHLRGYWTHKRGSGCGYSWVVANARTRLQFMRRWKKASVYTGIMFQINTSSLEKWLTFKLSVTSHLIFTSYRSVHTIHAAHESLCSIFKRTTPVWLLDCFSYLINEDKSPYPGLGGLNPLNTELNPICQ